MQGGPTEELHAKCIVVHLWVPMQGLIHCLTHIIPNNELPEHRIDFASEYVWHALTQGFIQPMPYV